jgi:hypothetical protein
VRTTDGDARCFPTFTHPLYKLNILPVILVVQNCEMPIIGTSFDATMTIISTGDEIFYNPRSPLSPFATNTFVVTNSDCPTPPLPELKYFPRSSLGLGQFAYPVLAPDEVLSCYLRRYKLDSAEVSSRPTGIVMSQPVVITTLLPLDLNLTRLTRSTSSSSSRTAVQSTFDCPHRPRHRQRGRGRVCELHREIWDFLIYSYKRLKSVVTAQNGCKGRGPLINHY